MSVIGSLYVADPRLDRRADAQGRAGRARLCRAAAGRSRSSARHNRWVASLPLRWRFYSSGLYISPLAPFALGFVAGMLTVLLGIGGGFILVPAMIYLLGMAARVVIGTSLVMILAVSAATTMIHALTTAVGRHRARRAAAGRRRRSARNMARCSTHADQARPAAPGAGGDHPARRAAHGARPRLAARRNLFDRLSVSAAADSLLLAFAPLLMAQAKPVLVPDISARQVEIRYSFTGAQLLLFGAILYPGGRPPDAPGRYRRRPARARSSRSSCARSRRSPASG